MADPPPSSAQIDETHTFLARDGLYYQSYAEMRNANVKANELRLKEMGLDRASREAVGLTGRNGAAGATKTRKRKASTALVAAPTNLRRSKRVRNVTPDPVKNLEDVIDDGDRPKQPTKKKTKRSVSIAPTLSEKDRKNLHDAHDWLPAMEKYLHEVEELSRQNFRNVVRQVEILVSGAGVTYHHWKDGVVFGKGRPVGLFDDLDALHDEAIDFENEHGRDLGNGTLQWFTPH